MNSNVTLISAILISLVIGAGAGMYATDYITTKDCSVLGKFRTGGVVYRCKPVVVK